MRPRGAIRVVGHIRFLGQDVQSGEQSQGLFKVEVVDVTPPLLVQQLEGQQTQQGAAGRYHSRAGITRLLDHFVESQATQEREEQKDASYARSQPASWGDAQLPTVGDRRRLRAGRSLWATLAGGSSSLGF